MIISYVRWRFRREKNLLVIAVAESQDVEAENFILTDMRNIMIIAMLFHGKLIQRKNAYKYKMEKDTKISLVTSIAFRNEKDINDFFRFLNRYF